MKSHLCYGSSLFALLLLLWFLLSGHTEPLLLGLGLVSTALVATIAMRMANQRPSGFEHQVYPLRFPSYALWLLKEIVVANVGVVRLILSRSDKPSPVVASLDTRGLNNLGKVIYANSITLTPGTVSIRLKEEQVEVHALTRSSLDGLEEGAMHQRVRRLQR